MYPLYHVKEGGVNIRTLVDKNGLVTLIPYGIALLASVAVLTATLSRRVRRWLIITCWIMISALFVFSLAGVLVLTGTILLPEVVLLAAAMALASSRRISPGRS